MDFGVEKSRPATLDGKAVDIVARQVPAGRRIRSLRLGNIKLKEVLKLLVNLVNLR
jgi:hypothetical protein